MRRFRDPHRLTPSSSTDVSTLPSSSCASVAKTQDLVEITIGPVAHGGHCVARIPDGPDAGRVVFVRHALPGEKVLARLTDHGKVWRADAVEVLENPSPYRVPSVWPEAGPDGVGGGELAHVNPQGQRLWKAAVVAEQMRRLASMDVGQVNPSLAISALTLAPLHQARAQIDPPPSSCGPAQRETQDLPAPWLGVEPAQNWPEGTGYRTRIDLLVDDEGRVGMRQTRSHTIVPLTGMPLATARLQQFADESGVWSTKWTPGSRLTIVAPEPSSMPCTEPSVDERAAASVQPLARLGTTAFPAQSAAPTPLILVDGQPMARPNGSVELVEQVHYGNRTFTYRLAPGGFWQVHAKAPETLVAAVMAAAGELEAHRVLELYSGAGLFTLPLATAIGSHGKLVTVEGSKVAVEYAQQNFADLADELGRKQLPKIEQFAGSVSKVLPRLSKANQLFDTIIVDPPREGLEKGVVPQLATMSPDRIIYISCDPAALARDTALLAQHGYHLTALRSFDLFPQTHHVESVATFVSD